MKLIGITGPTGAGKTTALGALKELGVQIIDADAVYHRLLAESAPLRQALTDRFGTEILDGAGGLDRKRLGAVVFADPAALEALNAITGPFIRAELDRLCAQAEQAGKHAAIDAIGLVESGIGERCHAAVAVLAPQDVRILRIMEREGISYDYARSRVESQKGEDFFRAHCSHVLVNDGAKTPAEFRGEALALFRRLLAE